MPSQRISATEAMRYSVLVGNALLLQVKPLNNLLITVQLHPSIYTWIIYIYISLYACFQSSSYPNSTFLYALPSFQCFLTSWVFLPQQMFFFVLSQKRIRGTEAKMAMTRGIFAEDNFSKSWEQNWNSCGRRVKVNPLFQRASISSCCQEPWVLAGAWRELIRSYACSQSNQLFSYLLLG